MHKPVPFSRCNWREAIFLVLILVVAALLRLVMLSRFPPGLFFDEAADALDAVNTLRSGRWPAFYDTQGGKEALWFWLLAVVFSVTGVGILQIRLTAAVVGLLTVVAVWWAARELFSEDENADAAVLALLSAAVLATLFVHVHFSRDGYRLLMQPLVGSLALAALWRGLRVGGHGWFLGAGILLGLAMYTYAAARFYVVLLVLFFVLERLLARRRQPALSQRYFWPLIGMAAAAVMVFAPMGLHLANTPELLLHRADEVSVFNPTWNQGRPWLALADSTWRNFAGLVWRGTMDRHWNIPGRPVLDVLTVPLFVVGVAVALRRWRRPPYLFLLLWLFVLYLPAVLSYDRVPAFHRSQGAVAAVAMLVALGAWTAWQWLAHRVIRRPGMGGVAVPLMVILSVSGAITARDYFWRWGPSWDAYLASQPYFLELVEHMNNEPEPGAVYLLPYDLRNGAYEHPDLQLFYHGSAPYVSISDHEGKMLADLTRAVAGREIVRVVDWKVGRSAEADPKRLIPALLTMRGQPLGVAAETPAYQIESFRLAAPNVDFGSLPPLQPLEVPVGNGLSLRSFAFGATGRPELAVGNPLPLGGYAWVLLVWRTAGPTSVDYKASVRLVDQGVLFAQQDKLLLNGFHLGTSQWGPGEENYDIYLFPLGQAGQYRLQILVYDPNSMRELMPGGVVLPGYMEVRP